MNDKTKKIGFAIIVFIAIIGYVILFADRNGVINDRNKAIDENRAIGAILDRSTSKIANVIGAIEKSKTIVSEIEERIVVIGGLNNDINAAIDDSTRELDRIIATVTASIAIATELRRIVKEIETILSD